MLRLKDRNATIVPEHIAYISVVSNGVYIYLVNQQEIAVNFKTEEDATLFGAYVELLIDFANNRLADIYKQTRRQLESYFENYLIPSDLNIASQGFVTPNEDKVVCIPANLKLALLDYLDKYHDISTKTIYNDLHGFIEKRRLHEEAYTEFHKGFTSQDRADAAKTNKERQKLYDDAITHYTKAIDLKYDLIEAYNNRGNAYYGIGDFSAAIDDFNKAIELDPEDAGAYNNRGNAYRNKGDFSAAIDDFNKAIELDPEDTRFYNNRGNVYYGIGDFPAAIDDYNKAVDLDPENAGAYNNRGLAYGNKNNFDKAIENYNRAIELNSALAEAYYNCAEVWLHLKEWKKAKADLTTAKEMGNDIIESFQNDYESVETFEAKLGVKVPKDIAALFRHPSIP